MTCALPVYGADGQLLGVAGADMYMDDMQQAVYNAAQSRGFLVVVNTSGHVIMSPEDQGVFSISNSAEAEDLRDSDIPELAALVSDAMRGKTDVRRVPLPDGSVHCFNEAAGSVFDLTSAQFGDTVLDYENRPEQSREVHFADAGKRQRYELLKARLLEAREKEDRT